MLTLATTVALFAFPATTRAAGSSGPRSILSIGCHYGDDICFADLDAAVGPTGCKATSIRWQPGKTNGKEIMSLLYGAFLAGKKVDFYVVDECFVLQPAFPTFGFATVSQ